jgi:DnaK suppressor protein
MTDARSALLAKRADLLARADGLTAAPIDTGGISFGKRVGDGTAMAVERLTNVAAHEQILIQLAEVDRALAKLDDGTYGVCDSCGGPIPEGRLEIHPWAVRCVACASGG